MSSISLLKTTLYKSVKTLKPFKNDQRIVIYIIGDEEYSGNKTHTFVKL